MRASHISDITLACKRDAAAVAQREPRREEWPLADAVAPPDPSDEEVPADLQIFKHTDTCTHIRRVTQQNKNARAQVEWDLQPR